MKMNGIRTHSGNYNNNMLNVTKLFSKQVKYCPKCLYEDYEKYGECYVHRAHQFDFMTCCHLHRVELIDYCPNCNCPLSKDYAETLLSKPQCPSCSNAIKVKKSDLIPRYMTIRILYLETFIH